MVESGRIRRRGPGPMPIWEMENLGVMHDLVVTWMLGIDA